MCTACALGLGARRRSCPPKVVRHSRALLADRSATVVRQTRCCPASPLRPCSEEVKARENADRKSQVGSCTRCLGLSIGFGGRVGLCGAASDTEISVGGKQQLPARHQPSAPCQLCLPQTAFAAADGRGDHGRQPAAADDARRAPDPGQRRGCCFAVMCNVQMCCVRWSAAAAVPLL